MTDITSTMSGRKHVLGACNAPHVDIRLVEGVHDIVETVSQLDIVITDLQICHTPSAPELESGKQLPDRKKKRGDGDIDSTY